ncbi:uncharacterized protein LOC133849058 [Drosophila sulfurigaster albostrigata]|uniref:uncharacterized protein LOC133849058 n=1 Tax=Drosophila sulfurigaster albostrigata TaxID=89887 RepID=UPI002D21B1EA|nr:uncharacterized protein LOC133849058 [Drosophila sulfurigaster albostrigata]
MCNTPNDCNKHKLKFTGCCSLSDSELSKLYNLDNLTDVELSAVGVDRTTLIDDYRHLHEMSQLREMERLSSLSRRFVSQLKPPKFKSPRQPQRAFSYDLLDRFFRCMQSETPAFCRFMENDLQIVTDFQRDTKILLMSPKERECACYDSYFEHLDTLYRSGQHDVVISIIAKVMVRFHREPHPVKLRPGFGRGYGPHYARTRTVFVKQKPKPRTPLL